MKRYIPIFATLLATIIVACNNGLVEENMAPSNLAEQITVTAYTPQHNNNSQSRVAIDYGQSGESWSLAWEEDDTFSVLRGSENQTFTKSSGENEFTGTRPSAGEGLFYATYPATTATDNAAVPFDISEPTDDTRFLMYGTSESGEQYNFKHALAYLRLTLKGFEGNLTKLVITTPSGVTTAGTIDLATGTLTTTGSTNSITLNYDASEQKVSGTTIDGIPIPPLAANNKALTIKITTDSQSYDITLGGDSSKAIEAGKFYTATVAVTNDPCNLPKGSTFRNEIAEYITNEYNGITFIAKSATTSENEIECVSGAQAYVVLDTENKIQIHTSAPEFVFNENCSHMFSCNANSKLKELTFINFNGCCNTSNVNDMNNMFNTQISGTGPGNLHSIDFTGFNTTSVTYMHDMFFAFGNANITVITLDLSTFNTSNVANMRGMFSNCYYLKSIAFGDNFNTSKVENMSDMFKYCSNLETIDLTKFTFNNNVTLGNMFCGVGSSLTSDAKTQIKVTSSIKTYLESKSTGLNSENGKAEYVTVD